MKITWLIEMSTIRVLNLFIFSKASFYVEDFMNEDAINVKQSLGDGILYFSTIYFYKYGKLIKTNLNKLYLK